MALRQGVKSYASSGAGKIDHQIALIQVLGNALK